MERSYDQHQPRFRNDRISHGDSKKSLYCGNLPFDISEKELKDQFSKFGTVVSCTLPRNPVTKETRGFGFIVLAEESQAEEAITHFSNSPDMIVQMVKTFLFLLLLQFSYFFFSFDIFSLTEENHDNQ